jgi:hypothetical protein
MMDAAAREGQHNISTAFGLQWVQAGALDSARLRDSESTKSD